MLLVPPDAAAAGGVARESEQTEVIEFSFSEEEAPLRLVCVCQARARRRMW